MARQQKLIFVHFCAFGAQLALSAPVEIPRVKIIAYITYPLKGYLLYMLFYIKRKNSTNELAQVKN